MAWDEYDDLLDEQQDDIGGQISDAENLINDAQEELDRVSRIVRLLGGAKLADGFREAYVEDLVGSVATVLTEINRQERRGRDNQLTVQRLLEGPQTLTYRLDDGREITGSFDFAGLANAVHDATGEIDGKFRAPLALSSGIENVERLWQSVVDTDVESAERRVKQGQETLATLEPVQADLKAGDDPGRQIARLGTLVPDAVAALTDTPPTLMDEATRAQLAALNEYVARPTDELLTPAERPAPAPAPAPEPAPVWEGAGEMLVDGRPQPAKPVELVGADAETQRAQFMAATATRPEMTVEEQIEAAVNAALAAAGVGGGTGGAPRLTAAEMRAANQTEVERLLAEQFGGFSFFLQKHRSDLQVGLTADGQVVAAGDPNATSVKNILDVIVDQGITAPTRVLGMLQNTEWWQKTDSRMREYDVVTADMSEAQKVEYLEPVLDLLRDEAQFLGFQLEPGRARWLAEHITRMGEETDSEFIRELLTSEQAFDAAAVTASGFAAARDEIVAMSKRYFTPIGEDVAAEYAQNIYVGTQTAEGVEQMFREQAAINYPQLQNALNAGITPEQYFAPYKYEIERMLDRPNVDLYEEFADVIQYIPDTGTAEARPMTLNEVRTYVRGLDEWQMSKQGKDSAAALAFAIGQSFGEVA